jgi:N-methylhydantoinase A
MWCAGVDTGGTFTDFIFYNGKDFLSYKVPSTPQNPSKAILNGLTHKGLLPSNLTYLVHGATIATNTLIERKGARVGLITTKNFEDIIEIARQQREKIYDLKWSKPPPLVKRNLRFGIKERISAHGKILCRLNKLELKSIAKKIKNKVDAIAVCFLFSYINPLHENLTGKILQNIVNLPLCLSHNILNEYREYERFATTVANAYVLPIVDKYISSILSFMPGLRIISSSGGCLSAQAAKKKPVLTILSGPAAGVIATKRLADTLGFPKVISFDMGGTSTDVSLIDKTPEISRELYISGIPISVPSIKILSIGAGGGSIAWLDKAGALRVGPQSAGAIPGPVCYSKGGTHLTVTDANLILGRIDPDYFLGGRMKLDLNKTINAFKDFSKKLKMHPVELARGIIEVVNSNMERAINKISTERGYDIKDFVLVAYGGAGPLHACELAQRLGIPKIIIPRNPGVFCASGMILSDFVKEKTKTLLIKPSQKDAQKIILQNFEGLKDILIREFKDERISPIKPKFFYWLDIRYEGQGYEILTPWQKNLNKTIEKFKILHEKCYGYRREDIEIEIVNVGARAEVRARKPLIKPVEKFAKKLVPVKIQDVFFLNGKRYTTFYYHRDHLYPNCKIKSPAIILEDNSTTLIPTEFYAGIDKFGNIIITRNEKS